VTLTPRPLTPSNQFRRFKGPQTTVRPHSVTPAHSDMEPLSHMTATDRTLIHLGRAIAASALVAAWDRGVRLGVDEADDVHEMCMYLYTMNHAKGVIVIADILTKGQARPIFLQLRKLLDDYSKNSIMNELTD
jgi:hypothetical protein